MVGSDQAMVLNYYHRHAMDRRFFVIKRPFHGTISATYHAISNGCLGPTPRVTFPSVVQPSWVNQSKPRDSLLPLRSGCLYVSVAPVDRTRRHPGAGNASGSFSRFSAQETQTMLLMLGSQSYDIQCISSPVTTHVPFFFSTK